MSGRPEHSLCDAGLKAVAAGHGAADRQEERSVDSQRHIVVMGVSGSGKTTIATMLAKRLERPFAEGDEFHSQENIDKMAAGEPLTDEDRWPWLRAMRDWMSELAAEGRAGVVTCSALRRVYRDVLRQADGSAVFVHLDADPALIRERVTHREGHFMPPELVQSQYDTLEPLEQDEAGVVVSTAAPPEQVAGSVLDQLGFPSDTEAR